MPESKASMFFYFDRQLYLSQTSLISYCLFCPQGVIWNVEQGMQDSCLTIIFAGNFRSCDDSSLGFTMYLFTEVLCFYMTYIKKRASQTLEARAGIYSQ